MYYLRKEPFEQTIPEIKKTDGTVIPERKYMEDDRALYKANDCSRFCRRKFTGNKQPRFTLYSVKKLSTILRKRDALFNYCGEYFDVYDENGKIKLDN